jgi:simple sugar transport system permease protein
MSMELVIETILTIVSLATPILLAATGELVAEKSGVLNLGVEGMMLCGAIAGFAIAFTCSDPDLGDAHPWLAAAGPWLGVVAAAAAGLVASLLFGFMTLTLGANQVASGLALVIFGTGISSLVGTAYVGIAIQPFDQFFPEALAQHPIGKVLFGYSPLVYFAFIMVGLVAWFLNRTRAGLVLRAVGENDLSAHSIGYSVIGVRYLAVMFGGAMAGIAGAYFSMVVTPLWAERMTAGRGWIALALVVFSGWRAGRLLGGAYFFAVFMTLELYAKASGFSFLPSQFWASMPYLMAVLVLAVMSARARGGAEAPACLGKPFIPDA